MATVSDLKRRIVATSRWLKVLEDGLNGSPHGLGIGEADAMEKNLAKLGIRLLSKTKAAKEGLELRRGAKHVVCRNYGAPIGWGDLYVEEQFKPKATTKDVKTITH